MWQVTDEGDDGEVVMGIKQIDGRIKQYIFATSTTDDGLVILVENGQLTTKAGVTVGWFKSTYENVESGVIAFELWNNAYATQLGIIGSSINGGGGGVTPISPDGVIMRRSFTAGDVEGFCLCNTEGAIFVNGMEGNVNLVETSSLDSPVWTNSAIPFTDLNSYQKVQYDSYNVSTGVLVIGGVAYAVNPPMDIERYNPEPEP